MWLFFSNNHALKDFQSINQLIDLRHTKQKITMNDSKMKKCVNRTQRHQKAALIGAITQHYGNKYKTNHNFARFL